MVPRVLRDKVLQYHHDLKSSAHRGIKNTIDRVKRGDIWHGMTGSIMWEPRVRPYYSVKFELINVKHLIPDNKKVEIMAQVEFCSPDSIPGLDTRQQESYMTPEFRKRITTMDADLKYVRQTITTENNMKVTRNCERYVTSCSTCNKQKKPRVKAKAALGEFHAERVHVDILCPFPLSQAGNQYVLVLSDQFTEWVEC